MVGHVLTAPLPAAGNLEAARAIAAPLFEADAVPGGDAPVFVALPWGPVAVYASGQIGEAEVVAHGSASWVAAV